MGSEDSGLSGTETTTPVALALYLLAMASAVIGTVLLGLGVALLGGPDFWAPVLSWSVTPPDAALLGSWALPLGVAVLLALFEDDLHRVSPGFTTLTLVGLLGLLVIGWRHRGVDWATRGAAAAVALLLGMMVSGLVGRVLFNSSTRGATQ